MMSEKKGKKAQDKVLTHPKFGEMIYDYDGWHPLFAFDEKMPLWGQVYKVELSFMAEDREQEVTLYQEEAYDKFERLITEQNDTIEQKILSYFKVSEEVAAVTFIPIKVYFGRRGECLLEFRDTEIIEEECADDVLPGFTLLLLPRLAIRCDDYAIYYMHRCLEGENIVEYGRDPIQELWGKGDTAININEINEEESRAGQERFRLKYGQALLEFDEESKKEAEELQKEIDSIEMPKPPIAGTIVGVIIFSILWAGLIGLIIFTKEYLHFWIFNLSFLGFTIAGISVCHDHWSDYRLAKRDFTAYKAKMLAKKKKEDIGL